MKKMLLIIVAILLMAVPAFAIGPFGYSTMTATSSVAVGSASSTFGWGTSGSLTIANNSSVASANIGYNSVSTYANSVGGTFTTGFNAITHAMQGGAASAYAHK